METLTYAPAFIKSEKKQQQIEIDNSLGFTTKDGVDVTERINKKKTQKFRLYSDAYEYATNKRSYIYPLYAYSLENRRRKTKFWGYAVPK